MKAVLFLGGMFPRDSKKIIEKSKGNIQYAANVFQWNVIDGFLQAKEDAVAYSFLSAPFTGSWPGGFSDVFVKKNTLEKNKTVEYIPFFNFSFIRNISRRSACKKAVRRWLMNNDLNEKYIVIYSAHTPFAAAVNSLKKKYKFKMHLIVPDLPQYMVNDTRKTLIYKLLKSIDIKFLKKALKGVDSYTFLTDKMNTMLNAYNKPYTVVEGMINRSEYVKRDSASGKNKTVVYTGGLTRGYGVKELVDSAEYLDPGIKLVLCGAGELEDYITEKAKNSENIVYYGQIPREKVLNLQAEAAVLVNPRQNNEEFTKYSFPSKILEYMLSGKPVLSYKLDGIPDEYDDVLIYFEKDGPAEIAGKINEVCAYTDERRSEIGNKILNFALVNKNELIQSKKILDCVFEREQ